MRASHFGPVGGMTRHDASHAQLINHARASFRGRIRTFTPIHAILRTEDGNLSREAGL